VQSGCGNDNSVVRGVASLGGGIDPNGMSGPLVVALSHDALGQGATGGIPHAERTIQGVDLSQGPAAFDLDMCAGGEMWSEENCSFHVNVFLDKNGDDQLQAGEPAGWTDVWISCQGEGVCEGVTLDCLDGAACFSFADPAYCGCEQPPEQCNSPIAACG
jgi:hypothetical protein